MREEAQRSAASSKDEQAFEVRRPSDFELGILYNWLQEDEETWSDAGNRKNPAPYYTRAVATGALQSVYEEEECGASRGRKRFQRCKRLVCAFATGGTFPAAFAVLKEDGVTIDAIGTCTCCRGKRAATALVNSCVSEARRRGMKEYMVDSLISSLLFWRKQGFQTVPAREIPPLKLKELEFHRPVVLHLR